MEVFIYNTWRDRIRGKNAIFSTHGDDKDGVIYTRASVWRDRERDKNEIFSSWRELK